MNRVIAGDRVTSTPSRTKTKTVRAGNPGVIAVIRKPRSILSIGLAARKGKRAIFATYRREPLLPIRTAYLTENKKDIA